jgi:hypothetical protein
MRFMMLMIPKGYEQAAPGTVPDARAVEATMKYHEELQKAGILLALEALQWATRCPASANETIEVRQIQEMTDFPAEVQKAAEGFTEMQTRSA